MSEIVTATTVLVASNVLTSSVLTPAAVGSAATGILSAAGIAGGAMGAAAFGNLLVNLPIWKDLQNAPRYGEEGFINAETFESEFLNQAERNYAKLLQGSTVGIPVEALDTIATVAALDQTAFVNSVARERCQGEVNSLISSIAKLPDMDRTELISLQNQAADLVEKALAESRTRIHDTVKNAFREALTECGWNIKDESGSNGDSAFIAVNDSGQSIYSHIERNGNITTDMAGFSGRDCEKAAANLFAALERKGIMHRRRSDRPHFLFAGGPIAKGVSKAAQILEEVKKPVARGQTASANIRSESKACSNRTRMPKSVLIQRLRNGIS
jgi:hypothetical protein